MLRSVDSLLVYCDMLCICVVVVVILLHQYCNCVVSVLQTGLWD